MKPTRALETSDRTPSSIPTPARRTGHTATFFPEMRSAVMRSSGVSISTSSVGISFVASYVSRSVSSFTSLRKWTVGVSLSRRYESLCWTSGCLTWIRRPVPTVWLTAAILPRARCRAGLRDVGGEAAEARVERPLLAERRAASDERRDVRALLQRLDDDRRDLAEIIFVEPAHRRRRRPEPHARCDHRRPLLERNGVPVRRDPHLLEPVLRLLPVPLRVPQVDLEQVRVGAAGEDVEAAVHQPVGESVGVRPDLALVVAERLGRRDLEARRLRGDRVLERPALHPGEDGAVDRLRVLLLAEDEAGARPGERLVGGRRDEVGVRHRVRVQAGRDESGEVRHVAKEVRADLVRDLAEAVGLDDTRVRGAAAHDHPRPVFLRELEHLVVVDDHGLATHPVVGDRVEAAREVDLEPVRQVAAVVEREREDRVPRVEDGGVRAHVRLRARVRLDVRVLRAEELLRPVDRELLDAVDELAAAVVAPARVALGVLVRRRRADCLQDRRPREVLRRDQLDLAALPLEFAAEEVGDLRVDLLEPGGPQVLERLLRDRHRAAWYSAGWSCYLRRTQGSFVQGSHMLRGLIAAAAAMLVFTPAAVAGGPSILVGAVEDAPKSLDASTAKAKLDLARLAGFDSVRITQIWTPGATTPGGTELTALQNVANAASLNGMRTIVAIYHRNGTATPADATARGQLAQYAAATAKALPSVKDFVIGNEPNSNTFWMPQFAADGSDAAAQAYLDLLARSYDAVKAVRPDARVIGGALAPRGEDSPASPRPTHSPVTFIADLGKAYRASGRSAPLMDVFDMHVYEDYSALPPSFDHLAGNTVAVPDYTKLVTSLGQAFDGTAQAGSTLPILYGEFGVESIIPAAKAGVYTGTEPAATKPVDEATQAAYYREAMKIAVCKPNVVGLMLFHVSDEANLAAWQSGPYYADDTAKSSLTGIRDAANAPHPGP